MTEHLLVNTKNKFKRFFEGLHSDFVRRLMMKMEYGRFDINSEQGIDSICIQKAGKVPKLIYFVISGKLGLYSFDGVERYMILGKGSVYGEVFILFGIPTTYTLKFDPHLSKRKRTTDVYKVDAEDFLMILKDYRCVYHTLKREGIKKREVYRKFKKHTIELTNPNFDPSMIETTFSLIISTFCC